MRKNQFSKRTGGRYTGNTPRNERYAHLSATGRRDGEDSGHSFHELAMKSAQSRRSLAASVGTSGTARASGKSSAKSRRKKKRWYAIADPHKPSWGVYSDWNEVKKFNPSRHRGFDTEHEAREWLEAVDNEHDIPTNVEGRPTSRLTNKGRGPRSSKASRKKPAPLTWYAVVRGYVPGVYANWQDAWVQTDGFPDPRPYKAKTRQEAVEIFMRWGGGHQRHPASSTMALRGEEIAEYAGKFLGQEGAAIIRARAREKHARVRMRKFEETGDPIWDTDSSTARTLRSVEAAPSAATSETPQNERQHPSNTHYPYATGESQEKVMGGKRGKVQSSKARRGMISSASAASSTTKLSPLVSTHKGGTYLSDESETTAALDSPTGAGQRDDDSVVHLSSRTAGDAHLVHSPVGHLNV